MFNPYRIQGLTDRGLSAALRRSLPTIRSQETWQSDIVTLQVRRPEPLVPGKIDFRHASSPAPDHVEVTVYLLGRDPEAMKIWLRRLAEEPEKNLGLKWDTFFRVSAYFKGLRAHYEVWEEAGHPDLWQGYGNRYEGWLAADDGGAWFIDQAAYQAACDILGITAMT